MTDNFARFISIYIENSSMTQKQIAQAIGYKNANIISQFKNGSTRIPLDTGLKFANLFNINKKIVLILWFSTYEPDFYEDLKDYLR